MYRKLGLTLGSALLWLLTLTLIAPVQAQEPNPHLGYGMLLAHPPSNLEKMPAGFDWFKYSLYWSEVAPNQDGVYNWVPVDTQMGWACSHNLNMLVRVERASDDWTPITTAQELEQWEAFFQALTTRINARRADCGNTYRVALEIWNEPNLDFQWTGVPLSATLYTRMVQRAYTGAKASDPNMLIIAGSLAPTGGDGVHSLNDVTFLESMYAAGLQGYFDAISIHNYGFGGPPEDKDYGYGLLNFRRAEDIYAVMVAHGDGDKPVWGTEFGWLLDSDEEAATCDAYWQDIGFAWQQVSAISQATYLTRAFAYADTHWPWMEVLIVSNLDFHMMTWYYECDPLRYFAVLDADGAARLAYTAVDAMPKHPCDWRVWGMSVDPVTLTWSLRTEERRVLTETLIVRNPGEQAFTWTAQIAAPDVPVTVTPATGVPNAPCQLTLDARSLPLGVHTGVLTLTASSASVPQSPVTLPIRIEISSTWGMAVEPTALVWDMRLRERGVISADITVRNTGDHPFTWTVMAAGLSLVLTPTTGSADTAFTAIADTSALSLGLHSGVITVTTPAPQIVPDVLTLPVSLDFWAGWGMSIQPTALTWRVPLSPTYILTADIAVDNTGDYEFDWQVQASAPALRLTTVPSSSWGPAGTLTLLPGTFRVFADPRGLSAGMYTGTITVSTVQTEVPESPLVIPVRVQVVPESYRVYLPLIMRK